MTGEPGPRDGALVTPHWQLDDAAATAPRRVLRGLPSATWPVIGMIRPGSARARRWPSW